ncbi:alanine racemase [Nakamurella panacisegetis]|uniref:Alanine racemase n=1 Tax=Nakamurella panacisegetis TaxID=1090615 RepID=A0A1H0P2T4_9ACTN|nr:alanine racemase [Nakamurella panacisegetis]SDO99273.1 alanine racemase [Nakamurella panacisegetis]
MDNIRAEAVIDLDAVRHNVQVLLAAARRTNPAAALMAVVKADGYGHGAVPVARAAREAGATALGVATPGEAVALIEAGIVSTPEQPIVAWLWVPDEDIRPALTAGVQLAISSRAHLDAVLQAARSQVAVHLKIDTGLGRGGATPADFAELTRLAARAEQDGRVRVVGLMSHLACADEPDDQSVPEQIARFDRAAAEAGAAGLTPAWRHLANTPGTLAWPGATYDLVRCGIGVYGISPFDVPVPGLVPAMTLRARVALTKRVPAGQGVSYGLRYRTTAETTLALVPVGYADGIPRTAAGAQVFLAGSRRPIAGRIAMDQFVVDCGDDQVAPGDEVLIFGTGERGEPTAADWAGADATIGYEIVTRIGPRIPRRYVGRSAAE